MAQKYPLVSAHTGGGAAPDNTMESFLEGMQSSADLVEIDLRVTADGTVVLLHDHSPLLLQHTYKQLNQYENRIQLSPIYENRHIVKFAQILEVVKQYDIQLNLDIKNEETVEPAMQCVVEYGLEKKVFVTGCSHGIASKYNRIRIVFNTPDELSERDIANYGAFAQRMCDEAVRSSAYGLNMDYRTCRKELVDLAHTHHLAIWVYTVNSTNDILRFIEMGVDAITTREPIKLAQLKLLL
ncbi:glycerophosphodiester phosphodiesterase [Paenibacillus sp. MER TA 81-3]|uniref:glycerophosphodiester phosphodiesterase n=1 Tax=Paenibacillus sp. MER TA 81-3 TaxID=2939573 RepID=UPI00203D0D94|nr:glycerophosphodiester phosphodiesterase [Paenibacillus sp. MER TA 81-3]MCM3337527.1 glycerophosphodiester phosphodiesterase [Paenibacillus sp. MER TA 81-3]